MVFAALVVFLFLAYRISVKITPLLTTTPTGEAILRFLEPLDQFLGLTDPEGVRCAAVLVVIVSLFLAAQILGVAFWLFNMELSQPDGVDLEVLKDQKKTQQKKTVRK